MKHAICLLALIVSTAAYADHDGKGKHPPVTKEQREAIAASYDKMAACLRSDKSIDVCHEELHTAMKESGTGCPMMEGHHMDHSSKQKKDTK